MDAHFFIREAVENRRITVPYVNTSDNLADFFTKAIVPRTFFALRNRIMNMAPESGGADADRASLQHGGVSQDSSAAEAKHAKRVSWSGDVTQ